MRFRVLSRLGAAIGLVLSLAFAGAAMAQSATAPVQVVPGEEPWQLVITQQIEAFRHHDAPVAFSFAGASFQQSYPNATTFFRAIIGSGYAPIMESTSHSFGEFSLDAEHHAVFQLVKLVGKSQELYEAVYMLAEEPAGWRVQGVQLKATAGVGI